MNMDFTNSKTKLSEENPVYNSAKSCIGPEGMLSILLPAYNLGRVIYANVERIVNLFSGIIPFEVIVIDDGSSDSTRNEIERASRKFPNVVKTVSLIQNEGKGAALYSGLRNSRGSHIFLLDADLDLNPSYIWTFFDIMKSKMANIVIGSKMHPESKIDYPLRRRIASFIYYSIVKLLIGLPVHDTQTGIKLFTRESLDYAFSRMLAKRFAFDLEVLAIAHSRGFKIAEAPVELDFGDKVGCLTVSAVRNVVSDTLAIFYRLKLLRYYKTLEPYDMPGTLPKISVVIVCPKYSECLAECLAGIKAQKYPNLEVIILPDEKSDKFLGNQVMEIPTGSVRPAEKRNIGIKAATGEIVAFIDDDATPINGWIDRAIPYFSNPDIAAVGGPAATPGSDLFMAQAGGNVYKNIFVSGSYRHRYTPVRVCDEEDLPSCNLIVRKSVLDELGGFNTVYWPGEDTILCLDIKYKLKKRIVYDPWVLVAHHRRPLFRPHLRQIGRYARHRGFFVRHFPETSFRISYMLPSFFVLGLVLGLLLAAFGGYAWRSVYFGIVTLYIVLTFFSSINTRSIRMWIVTWLGVMMTHVVYGVCFAIGLLSAGMTKEVRPFDHHSSIEETTL